MKGKENQAENSNLFKGCLKKERLAKENEKNENRERAV